MSSQVAYSLEIISANELMPYDKDFDYVGLTRGLTCGHYGDLWHDTEG